MHEIGPFSKNTMKKEASITLYTKMFVRINSSILSTNEQNVCVIDRRRVGDDFLSNQDGFFVGKTSNTEKRRSWFEAGILVNVVNEEKLKLATDVYRVVYHPDGTIDLKRISQNQRYNRSYNGLQLNVKDISMSEKTRPTLDNKHLNHRQRSLSKSQAQLIPQPIESQRI